MLKISIKSNVILILSSLFFVQFTWAQNQITIPPSGDNSSLKALASNCGLNMANLGVLPPNEPDFERILKNDFNMVGSDNGLKMVLIKKTEIGPYDFSGPDQMVAFAKANNMKVRGHTILWHSGLPGWMITKSWTRQSLLTFLKNYIQVVVGRYKGKIDEWDVANEFINTKATGFRDGDNLTNGEGSIWIKYIGPEVLDSAFKWVHQIDPKAKLYYNDFFTEGMNPKSDKVYDLVKGMKNRGVPIHGVGFQCHFLNYELTSSNGTLANGMDLNIKRLGALDLEVAFTEIDFKIFKPVGPTDYYKQALSYGNLLQIALNNRNIVKTFMIWGITDKHTWINKHFPNTTEPLFYTGDYQKKPAYDQMVAVLKANCPVNTAPEIQVKQGANSILSSTGKYDFTAPVLVGNTSAPITFTIQNSGTATLNIGAITMTGTNPAQFVVTQIADQTIAGAGSSTFTLQFKPTNVGAKTAIVSIANNDPNESPYTFIVNANATISTNLEEETGSENLAIFPNPSNDGIFNLSQTANWKVTTILGKELKSETSNHINLSDQSKGVYLIKIKDKVERLVVE